MNDPHTARIREHVCPFCGAAVDRDIDGMYECGTAWGAAECDREPECFMAEIEVLRSKPSAAEKLNELVELIGLYKKHLYQILGPSESYNSQNIVLNRVVSWAEKMIRECEDNNDS